MPAQLNEIQLRRLLEYRGEARRIEALACTAHAEGFVHYAAALREQSRTLREMANQLEETGDEI